MTMRPWALGDADELRPLQDDPGVRSWTRDLPAEAWIDAVLADTHRHSFAVLRDGAIAGNIALKTPRPGRWEVGYWTAAHARRQGVAAWALQEVTRWGFTRFAMTEIALIHNVDNVASCAVARRCDYRLDSELPPSPGYPLPGHRHVRKRA
ncbi:GNAT family N-acetyltransferase [Actinoplanes sp. HUAS TT8]|uniref:GNAT family N-acetyltransferase n=1 Tax=Actinoplanes sp. HUAS TT8 TaxID=3447453 RepID=UPI003F51C521